MPLRTARIIAACDAAAELLLAEWQASDTPPGALDGVEREWFPDIGLTEDAETPHTGRRLYVIPAPDGYTSEQDADGGDRGDLQRNYKFRVLMVERFVASDPSEAPNDPTKLAPSKAWTDERVNFFEQRVFNVLANPATVLLDEMSPARNELASVEVVFQRDVLKQHKTFWSWAEFPFAEGTDLNGEVQL